ncbi:peptidase C1B, bleomycin hydrolase [Favolaschia claudopus]|uniref:Cysteine proteinase 1, mitochondrial n=1 Tax=Favolaschia claudopus TaxID=2862362 RepID=A0AAW0E1P6_9AGAR
MGAAPSKQTTPLIPTRQLASLSLNEKQGLLNQDDVVAHHPSPLVLRSSNGALTDSNIADWEETASNPTQAVTRAVLARADVSVLQRRKAHRVDQHIFNTVIDFKTGPIANQRQSGRCWLFAGTNVLRYNVMRKLNLAEFQLSQNHLYFYDKLEKANYYLELTIENSDLPLSSRLLSHLSADLVSDGGQFDMIVNLVERYGLVPFEVFPESFHSVLSKDVNTVVKSRIREHAIILRKTANALRAQGLAENSVVAALRAKKEQLMAETYRILTAMLGVPLGANDKFTWNYNDKDGKYGEWSGTPLEFYKCFIGTKAVDSISLINDPRNPYDHAYVVEALGNVWGGRPVVYANTVPEVLKSIVVKAIKAGEPVFFGCDVMKYEDRDDGLLDLDLFEYDNAFDTKATLNKAERLEIGESLMTHAMVFTGVHLDEAGKIVRFKVENAWGTAIGNKGWFTMTDAWFDQFVYQIVIPKRFVPKNLVDVYENGERTVLDPWDPMGALA